MTKKIIILIIFSFLLLPVLVYAANTTGYAWGENVGWINFNPTNGGVTVTDSALTGYAWGENVGWINFNPTEGGVSNDSEGNLTGYAWGENAGWINFNPTNSQVIIDGLTGNFSGYAWGENVGWISLNCSNGDSCATVDYEVDTSWMANQTPAATSASVSLSSVNVGTSLTFTGNWTDLNSGDDVNMYVCKDASCTSCNSTTQANCWCSSTSANTEPDTTDTCSYTALSGNIGDNSYWLGVCDQDDACDTTPLSGGTFSVTAVASAIVTNPIFTPPVSYDGQGNISSNAGGEVRRILESGKLIKVTFPKKSVKGTVVAIIELKKEAEIIKTNPLPKNTQIVGGLIADFKVLSGGKELESFEKKVSIIFDYTDEQVKKAGIDEKILKIHRWNEKTNKWEPLETIVDTTLNRVTAYTLHFTLFAVFGEKEEITEEGIGEEITETEEEEELVTTIDNNLSKRVSGKILLQVEKNGEGWYVYPDDKKRYYLGRPLDAFNIMRNLGLGIKHSELNGYLDYKFPSRLSGKIMLDVEQNGEAYYINPEDLRGYYLSRPADAFRIMGEFGLGITNSDLGKIGVGRVGTGYLF